MRYLLTLIVLALLAAAAGCSDADKAKGPSSIPVTKGAQKVATQATPTAPQEQQPEYAYSAGAKRDPFAPLIVRDEQKATMGDRPPLERYNLHEFKMSGIVWGGFGYNAMLEGPDGKGYFVRVGTVIGPNKGVVKKITQYTMVVEEKFKTVTGDIDRKEIIIELRKKQEGIQ